MALTEQNKKKLKEIAKIFIALYLISFFIINWNDVSWIFNYRAVYGIIDDFFTPYSETQAYALNTTFYPNRSQEILKQTIFEYSEKNNLLEVPKMGISVPIFFPQTASSSLILKELDKGVVYYPGSVLPGQNGQIIILGHSAPPNWPKIKNDWVFSGLNKLEKGDKIFLYINYKKYTYTVMQKKIFDKGKEITPLSLAEQSNSLALISCWPPGKDLQRISVQAAIDKN